VEISKYQTLYTNCNVLLFMSFGLLNVQFAPIATTFSELPGEYELILNQLLEEIHSDNNESSLVQYVILDSFDINAGLLVKNVS
jgi:hypothetical protein